MTTYHKMVAGREAIDKLLPQVVIGTEFVFVLCLLMGERRVGEIVGPNK